MSMPVVCAVMCCALCTPTENHDLAIPQFFASSSVDRKIRRLSQNRRKIYHFM